MLTTTHTAAIATSHINEYIITRSPQPLRTNPPLRARMVTTEIVLIITYHFLCPLSPNL
jgi:hypothetical protein